MEQNLTTAESNASLLHSIGESTIYLMGLSFVVGCLFTVLILLLLDFIRRNAAPEERK